MHAKCVEILVILIIIVSFGFAFLDKNHNYLLQRVVIVGRHNMRVPFRTNLSRISPNKWPKWNKLPAELTENGVEHEKTLGKHLGKWLRREGLLGEKCPNDSEFYIYSNSKNRTKFTAKAFVEKVFPSCNITIHHLKAFDPIFNPIIYNSSQEFFNETKRAMEKRLNESNVDEAVKQLDNIINITESNFCKIDKKCSLLEDRTVVNKVVAGSSTSIKGTLGKANAIIDNFIMQFYDGKEVAWGQIKEIKDFEPFFQITDVLHSMFYSIKFIAKDLSRKFLENFEKIVSDEKSPKVYMIVGHDTNIMTMMTALDFKPYVLKDQIERIPVGSKLIYQKWHDKDRKIDLFKVEYVYQRVDKFNNGTNETDVEPYSVSLEIKGCEVDSAGFCLWSDFIKTLPTYANKCSSFNQTISLRIFSALGLVCFVLIFI